MSKIISICMSKGGVGKSLTTINLGAAFSIMNKKVLIVDMDPQQGNATLYLNQKPDLLKYTLANVISTYLDLGEIIGLQDAVIKISDNIDLLPANSKLVTTQDRLIIERSKSGIFNDDNSCEPHMVLKTILASVYTNYDYVLIDCPASISMLTINALVASDNVILPMEARYESFESLRQIIDVINRIKLNWNKNLSIEGILITKYQKRTTLCREVNELTEKSFGSRFKIFPDAIPLSTKAAELSGYGLSIFEHAPESNVATAYMSLAKEVILNE